MYKTHFLLGTLVVLFSACNGDYKKQLELAKKEKCELLSNYGQLKTDSTNAQLRSEIERLERMINTRAELSGNQYNFREELKATSCDSNNKE